MGHLSGMYFKRKIQTDQGWQRKTIVIFLFKARTRLKCNLKCPSRSDHNAKLCAMTKNHNYLNNNNELIFISYWCECWKIFMPFMHAKIFTGKIYRAEKSYDELHFHILCKFWVLIHPAEIASFQISKQTCKVLSVFR